MKNLCILDYYKADIQSANIKLYSSESHQIFFHNEHNLYEYNEEKSSTHCFFTNDNIKINEIISDELLNSFCLILNNGIVSISYEFHTNLHESNGKINNEFNRECKQMKEFHLTDIGLSEEDVIIQATLSPNKELIVIITESNWLILLSSQFKVYKKMHFIHNDVRGEKDNINVGWGKVETQFQGSKRNVESVVKVDEVDKGAACLVWRSDSQFFAINYYNPDTNVRHLQVYSDESILQYTSKPLSGLERLLSWRPHVMSHLASTQRLPNKYNIVFIEKNTELKDSFELKNVVRVVELKWNLDGTLLFVLSDQHQVLVYSNSNWNWYLKQNLNFSSPIQLTCQSKLQCTVLHKRILSTYHWKWVTSRHNGLVSVINSNQLLITNFNKTFIPPPHYLQCILIDKNISNVLYLSSNNDNASSYDDNIAVVAYDGMVTIYKNGVVQSDTLILDHFYKLDWISEDSFVYATDNELYLTKISGQKQLLATLPSHIVTISKQSKNEIIIQLSNLHVYLYTISTNQSKYLFTLTEPSIHMSYALGHYVHLSGHNVLYDNSDVCATDVSSYIIYKNWLILTMLTHCIVVYKLEPERKIEEGGSMSRRVERGAQIVTVTDKCNVVLQMPRGNLETITPRPLILNLLSELLEKKQYKAAFIEMRKHRIDLNLMVDYGVPDYKQLVAQIADPQWLSCLVADLKSEDVTRLQSCYAEYYSKFAGKRDIEQSKSIEKICSHLCTSLEKQDPDKYLQVIIHCYVKCNNMERALELARTSSEGLNFLILLQDVNELYEKALRMYDLDLALIIAGKSLKDPKEYIPYLNKLRTMAPYKMKYEIDKQFNNHLRAVQHLATGSTNKEEIEQCQELIRKHQLWAQVLNVFPKNSNHYKDIHHEYGCKLELKGRHLEAAVLFERAESIDDAIRAYAKAGSWRYALALAKKLNYGPDKLDKLYLELVRSLESRRDYVSLMHMLELRGVEHIEQHILNCLRENQRLAIELIYQYDLQHLLESHIKPTLTELTTELSDEICNYENQFVKHFDRLQYVRSLPKPVSGMLGEDDMSDWGSDTSSTIVSSRSGQTGTSMSSRGRRKRKQDRKLWSLREGNPREEISLVKTIAEDVMGLENCTGRVKDLCQSLLKLDLSEEAKSLQDVMKLALNNVEKKKELIWSTPQEDETSYDDIRVNLPPNSNVVHNWELECLKNSK